MAVVHERERRPTGCAAHDLKLETDLLSVSLSVSGDGDRETAVLNVRGELDLATAPVLLEAMVPVIARGSGTVLVDLFEVGFMDLAGVHVLLDAHERLRSQNRRLAVTCHEHGQVHRLLAMVGWLDNLNVYDARKGITVDNGEAIPSEPSTPPGARHA